MVAKSARLIPLIALAAVAVGAYLIIHSGLATHHSAPTTQATSLLNSPHQGRPHRRTPKFYVVRAGDTLSGISVRTHVPVAQLTLLNQNINPNSLQTGQRLRLRR